MDDEFVICSKSELVAIADAVRAKSGSSGTLTVLELPQAVSSTGINLDAEMNAQDAKIASQDSLIANIVSALEGKAAGGGGVNVPEMVTVTFEVTGEYPVNISYLGIDENNNITEISMRQVTSGTFETLKDSFIYVDTDAVTYINEWDGTMEDIFPQISCDRDYYAGGCGTDYSVIAISIFGDTQINFETVLWR